MKLSIVTTLYQSSLHISEFYDRVSAVAECFAGDDYEILFVNDGSPDNSGEQIINLIKRDKHLVLIDLSRNFGHHKAIMTGLQNAKGDYVFLLDSDLEEDPELLIDFSSQLFLHNCDVVYGVQSTRKGNWFERFSGSLFYRIFRFLSRLDLPSNIIVMRLMTKRYVRALIEHRETEVFLAGLWHITGFTQMSREVLKHHSSPTTYTLSKKLSMLVNSVTSFSNAPLYGIFIVGIFIFFISCIYSMYLVMNWLFLASPPGGYTSLMASVWLLGGMLIMFIGIVGIYLAKIFLETKRRPYSIIKKIYRNPIYIEDNE
jgi:putative glycosyltransferase